MIQRVFLNQTNQIAYYISLDDFSISTNNLNSNMDDQLVKATPSPTKANSSTASADIDLKEFKTLDVSDIRSRYPAILKLFKYRISNDKRNRDALCNGCRKIIVKSKVSRLINHAKKCSNCDESLVKQLEQSYRCFENQRSTGCGFAGFKSEFGFLPPNSMGPLKKSKPEVKKLQKAFDDQLIDLLTMNLLPSNFIESREFRTMISSLIDQSYQIPNRERLNSLLTSRANSETSKLIGKFKESENYSITIELVGHSSSQLMAVILTGHNGCSALLEISDISPDPNTSTNIAEKALNSILASKIVENKFNVVLCDDTPNFILARDIIYEDFNKGRMIVYRSVAHVLNQMSGSLMKSLSLKTTFERLLHLIEVVNRNKYLILKLKERGQPKVHDAMPTRKSVPSICINWALQIKASLMKMPKAERYQPELWESLLEDSNFWLDLEKCKGFFTKLSLAIKITSSVKLSDAFHAYLEFGKSLMFDNSLDTSIKDLFVEAYVTYFRQLDLDLLLAAYVLDPNKRLANLTNKAIRSAKEYIMKALATMGCKDTIVNAAISEFKLYTQSLKTLEEQEDIYSWWSNGESFILKTLGQRLAAAPATAVNTQQFQSSLDQLLVQDGMNMSLISDLLSIQIAQVSQKKRERSLEKAILDSQVINTCCELSEDPAYLYSSEPYQLFKSFIDYGSPPSETCRPDSVIYS